jgi:hypothetical protein
MRFGRAFPFFSKIFGGMQENLLKNGGTDNSMPHTWALSANPSNEAVAG